MFAGSTSIKHKLLALGMTSCLSAIILFSLSVISVGTINFRQALMKEQTLISTIIGNRLSAALYWEDLKNIQKDLDDLNIKESIIFGCVFDKNKKLVASYKDNLKQNKCAKLNISLENKFNGLNQLTVATNIYFADELVGKTVLVSDLRELKKQTFSFILTTCAIALVISLLVLYIVNRMQKNISIPVLNLANIMSDIRTNNNYDKRANVHYNDEIGSLTEAFNEMLDVIHKRDTALKEANDLLETKVIERTKELQKRTNQLEITLGDLQTAIEVKSQFLGNMSHEIRTPIHGVINFLQFLVDDWTTMSEEEKEEMTRKAHKASRRLLELINNLLDISKFESQNLDFKMVNNDLISAANIIINETESLRAKKKLKLEIINNIQGEAKAEFDEGRIKQVISNLFGNAIKFTDVDTTLTVTYSIYNFINKEKQTIPMIKFSIKDEGIGIPENELKIIFEKFIESSRTKNNAGGTGLGLSICKSIIEAHGGEIWAENNPAPAKGSTVSFMIPITQPKGKSADKDKDKIKITQ